MPLHSVNYALRDVIYSTPDSRLLLIPHHTTASLRSPARYNPVLTYHTRRPVLKNCVGTSNRGARTKPGKSVPSFINLLLLTQADIINIIIINKGWPTVVSLAASYWAGAAAVKPSHDEHAQVQACAAANAKAGADAKAVQDPDEAVGVENACQQR